MLEIKDGALSVGGRCLFARLSFVVNDGQLVCVTGSKGVGKTMLARALVGLVPLSEGFINVDGSLLTALSAPAFRQFMAYLPQWREPVAADPSFPTSDLENLWSPFPFQLPAAAGELRLPPFEPSLTGRQVVVADDPSPSLLPRLRALAAAGAAVVVMSCRQEYLSASDKQINLEHP